MKWEECSGSYKAVVSLGSSCQTAYQLKRLGLRGHAGPLDWFISQSAKDVVRLIRNRFKGFMSMNNFNPGYHE
jgi:hypothetical protein